MKEIFIDELKKIQLDVLLHLDAFCKENNIQYFLCGGTLIGAIRHNGFIPWDDDIDVMMTRENYDKFAKLYSIKDKSEYKYFSCDIDKNYPYTFAKLSNENTMMKEYSNCEYDMGVNIDIFPVEYVSDNKKEQQKVVDNCQRYINMMNLKRVKISSTRNLVKNIVLLLSQFCLSFISTSKLVHLVDNIAKKSSLTRTNTMAVLVWGYKMRELQPASNLESQIMHKFEDLEFPIPIGYDDYLRRLYGDYMQLPPADKQVTHHCFKAYWKD